MRKFEVLDRFKNGTVNIEIQGMHPEKLVNILWTKKIDIKNLIKVNITTLTLDINIKNLTYVKDLAKENKCTLRISKAKGVLYWQMKLKKGGTLVGGIFIFIFLIYYLSLYIWNIDITTSKYLSSYEVRKELLAYGIKPGIKKSSIDVYDLEKKLINNESRIMWIRIRMEGGTLKVKIEEKQNPPVINSEKPIGDMVAKMDGEIVRIYTTSGSAVVKKGDIVKCGDVVIKGIQGKEGFTYETSAEGTVIAKTFYEDYKSVDVNGTRKVKTGNEDYSIYISIFGKKLYLKKYDVKYSKYDKIEESGKIFNKDIYYETKEESFDLDAEGVANKEIKIMEEQLSKNLYKTSKIVDKIINKDIVGNKLNIRVVFTVEQDIAERQGDK